MAARKRSEEQLVRVAPLGELRAYTISEHELEKLVEGAPASDLLTIGLCLLSAALTLLATLLTTSLSEIKLTLFFCALLITGLIGAICTFLGWRWRTSAKELGRQIRARMPEAPIVQQIPPESMMGPPAVPGTFPPSTTREPPSPSTPSTEQRGGPPPG